VSDSVKHVSYTLAYYLQLKKFYNPRPTSYKPTFQTKKSPGRYPSGRLYNFYESDLRFFYAHKINGVVVA